MSSSTRLLIQVGAFAGAVAGAVLVWVIARYGFGLHLVTPVFGPVRHPQSLNAGIVAGASAVASLAGLIAARIIERVTGQPKRYWLIASLVVLVLSLAAPLSGHGVTAGGRLALACMHIVVAAVLIPVLSLTMSARRQPGASAPQTVSAPAEA
jgi:hypothetical protein